jgi:hypothetical protein
MVSSNEQMSGFPQSNGRQMMPSMSPYAAHPYPPHAPFYAYSGYSSHPTPAGPFRSPYHSQPMPAPRIKLNVTVYFTENPYFNPNSPIAKSQEELDSIQMLVVMSGEKSVHHLRHRLAKSFEIINREQGRSVSGYVF